MARGGARTPPKRTPPGGPGQFSRRTDGQQIATPGLAGSDLQSGDIGKLREAQKIAPLPAGTPEPRPPSAMRKPAGTRTQGGSAQAGASHLFTMPDENPNEPTTNGLAVGPGVGPEGLDASTPSPDLRQMVLQSMWIKLGNQEAGQMLQELIADKESRANAAVLPPEGPPPPPVPAQGEEPTSSDVELGETAPGPSSVR